MLKKQNSKSKFFTMLVVVVLVLSIGLVGCGDKNSGNNTNQNTPKPNEQTSTPPKGDEGSGTEVVDVYPIDTNEGLTFWRAINGNLLTSFANLGDAPFGQKLKEETGIKNLKFLHPADGTGKEQFNLMVAGNDLPDIIEYDFTQYPGGPAKAIADKIILPLNDLIDQHAPNLKRILEENPDLDKMVKTDDGEYYVFPMIRSEIGVVFRGPIIRKDWLDDLKLEVPTTIDEWYVVLKAFKEEKGATAPFAPQYGGQMNLQDAFFGAYETSNGFYLDDSGSVRFGPTDPQYKEVVELFRKWYGEGLLDKDFPITNGASQDQKMLNGEAGATIHLLGGGLGKWLDAKKDSGESFNIVAAPYPTLKKGDKPFTGQRDFPFNPKASAAISTKAKNPELAVKLLDYAYSEAGMLLWNYGIEGESYEFVNGVPQYTDLILNHPEFTLQQQLTLYTEPNGPYPMYEGKSTNTHQQQDDAVGIWGNTDAADHILPLFITPSVEESSEVAQIMTAVNTYKEEMFIKFIMGQEPIEKFDSFVAEMKKMNIDRVVEIYQNSYERYSNR